MATRRPRAVATTNNAPVPIGPYSQAVDASGFLFLSGQAGYVPATRELAGPDIETQTRQTLSNITAVLEKAGSSLDHVAKATVYLAEIDHREAMNREYMNWFRDPLPARTTIAATLPDGLLIEMDVVAVHEAQARPC